MKEDYNKYLTGIEALDKGFERGTLSVIGWKRNERPSKSILEMRLRMERPDLFLPQVYLDMEMSLPHSDNTIVIDSADQLDKISIK